MMYMYMFTVESKVFVTTYDGKYVYYYRLWYFASVGKINYELRFMRILFINRNSIKRVHKKCFCVCTKVVVRPKNNDNCAAIKIDRPEVNAKCTHTLSKCVFFFLGWVSLSNSHAKTKTPSLMLNVTKFACVIQFKHHCIVLRNIKNPCQYNGQGRNDEYWQKGIKLSNKIGESEFYVTIFRHFFRTQKDGK